MLNAKAFAHAATVVTVVFYVGCLILSYLFPDLIFYLAKSWVHSVSIDTIRTNEVIKPSAALFGLTSLSTLTWVTTYVTIWLYNRLNKK